MNLKNATLILLAGAVFTACGPSQEEIQAEIDAAQEQLDAQIDDAVTDGLDDINVEAPDGDAVDSDLYTSKDGHFSINFPGSPEHSSDVIDTDIGPSTIEFYMYEKSASEVFMVSFNDYHDDAVLEADAQTLLHNGRDGALGSLQIGYTDEEKVLDIDGNPGLYFKGNNGTLFVVYEIYLVKHRLYQLAILQEGSYPSEDEIQEFIGTFQLNQIEGVE